MSASPAPGCRAASAFSLIELLAVVALLVIFNVLYFSTISGRKQRSLKAVCAQNLQKIYVGMNLYSMENETRFPSAPNAKTSAQALRLLVPKYTSDASAFICPGTGKAADIPTERFASQTISYSYYMGLAASNTALPLLTDCQVDTASKSKGQLVFSASGKSPGNNHKKFGGNLLFCDGQIQTIGTNAPFAMLLQPGVVLLNP